MAGFTDLLDYAGAKSPGEAQQRAGKQFPAMVARSRLLLLEPGQPSALVPDRFVIGVEASYNFDDLSLLDAVNEQLNEPEFQSEVVQVFNMAECKTDADLEKYVPRIGQVFQSPVVGIWQNGKQTNNKSGHAARQLILEHFHLPEDGNDRPRGIAGFWTKTPPK